jgi:dCMP deaminase
MAKGSDEVLLPKDGVKENTHPLNLVPWREGLPPLDVTRPPLYEVYMRMAEELAKRSTCARLQVGTVLTDSYLENVVAIGYNGNARGFPNRCDSTEPGRCGCIHSEQNALVKAPGQLRDKVAFVTASPCVACAKLMIQANVTHLFFREAYRDPSGLEVLDHAGVIAIRYTRWKDDWR